VNLVDSFKAHGSNAAKRIPRSGSLLHDVDTGNGMPQAAKPGYLDQSTANKFRTAAL